MACTLTLTTNVTPRYFEVRSQNAAELEAQSMNELRAIQSMNESHAMEPQQQKQMSFHEPSYQTDAAIKEQYAAYEHRGYDADDAPDTFKHYGRGLQWNPHEAKMYSGTMTRMNQAAVTEAEDLFSSFLDEVKQVESQTPAVPSWKMVNRTVAEENKVEQVTELSVDGVEETM